MRKTVILTCPQCNKEFEKIVKDIKAKITYCSYKCRGIAGKKWKNRTCSECGILYHHSGATCSKKCSAKKHSKWVRENQGGENNPFYGKRHKEESKIAMSIAKRGKRKGTYSKKYLRIFRGGSYYRRTQNAVKIRDGYRCQYCGGHGEVTHHIIPLRDFTEITPTNLITLCKDCHHKTYNKEYEYVHFFLGIIGYYYANS